MTITPHLPFLLTLTLTITTLNFHPTQADFNMTFLHTNDFHAHYAPFNGYGSECSPKELARPGACYAGYARVEALVKRLRAEYPISLLCDAGDQSQGTLWYAVHRNNITSHFMNRLGYDVMCAGNHEFDNGEDSILDFSRQVDFPVISSNLNKTAVPHATNETTGHTVITVAGQKIGFVGYTTRDTSIVSFPGRFTFDEEVEAVKREVAILQGLNISMIVALGHSGFDIDQKVAAEVEGIDLVIGGHDNVFLYTGPQPGRETPVGEYPFIVTQASGKKVPIVQDYMFIKYLGVLHVTFDDLGNVISWSGNPILINDTFPEDEDALKDLQEWQVPIDEVKTTVLSRSSVVLDHKPCRTAECNIGNMMADGLVFRFSRNPPPGKWSHASIGLVNGGSIRISLPQGPLTLSDFINAQAFANSIDVITLAGKHLKEVLHHSISSQYKKGGFFQLAGLKVTYKYHAYQANLSEVVDVKVRCSVCPIPVWGDLEDDKDYTLSVNNFIIGGGDGYYHFKKYGKDHRVIGAIDQELTADYAGRISPIIHGLEDRIKVIEFKTPEEAAAYKKAEEEAKRPCPTMNPLFDSLPPMPNDGTFKAFSSALLVTLLSFMVVSVTDF